MPQSEFYPISGDLGELGIRNLARMFLTECYWMLQNARVTTFTVSELLRLKQQGVKLPPTQIRVKNFDASATSELKFRKKRKNRKGCFQWYKKVKKSALLLNSVNLWAQWPKFRTIVLKKKTSEINEFFQSFEWIT